MNEENLQPSRREWFGHAAVTGAAAAAAYAQGPHDLPRSPAASTDAVDMGQTFNVRRFGARADGETDDTAAAQAAIDAAIKAGGGHVYFPAGQYRLTRTLRIGSIERMDITGDGWSSILQHENDEPLLLWPQEVSCRECSVRHLRFVSTGVDKSPGTAVIACLGGVERSMFSHLLLMRGSARLMDGIVTEVVADTSTFDHCLMWGVTGTGIRLARGSEIRIFGGRITGESVERPQGTGILLTGNNGGVHVVTTDLIGLHTAMKIGQPGHTSNREVFITHATFDSCVHGLWQVDNAYTSIAGCWAASSDEDQIRLDETAVHAILTVAGGTIFNGGAYGRPGAHHGIVVRGGRFSLSGVTIRHNKGTGILVEGDTVRHYTITGCRIHDNGTGALLGGRDFAFIGNVFSDNETDLIDRGQGRKEILGNVLRE
jgi:hypothetical protein